MKIGFNLIFKNPNDFGEVTKSGALDMPGVKNAGDARGRAIAHVKGENPDLADWPCVDSAVGKAR